MNFTLLTDQSGNAKPIIMHEFLFTLTLICGKVKCVSHFKEKLRLINFNFNQGKINKNETKSYLLIFLHSTISVLMKLSLTYPMYFDQEK